MKTVEVRGYTRKRKTRTKLKGKQVQSLSIKPKALVSPTSVEGVRKGLGKNEQSTKVMGKETVKCWYVESWSNPNKKYKVCQLSDGSFSCSCPAWVYRRQECKHIQQVKHQLAMGNDFGSIAYKDIWILQPYNSENVKLIRQKIDREKRECKYYVGVPLIPVAPPNFKLMNKLYAQLRKLGVPKKVIKEYWHL